MHRILKNVPNSTILVAVSAYLKKSILTSKKGALI